MPTPSTFQSYMKLYRNAAPMVDTDGILRKLIFSFNYLTKVADYTVKYYETGTVFVTTGATGNVNFTLPAISTGPWNFKFFNLANVNLTVTAGTADTMIGFNDLDLDSIALSTSSEKIGGGINVYCDGTSLFVGTEAGDPRYQTYTLAD